MARIWYSVGGEGMGHAIRSRSILEQLKGHRIIITAAEKAYPYLKKRFRNTYYIYGNTFVYRNNRVMQTESFLKFIITAPYKIIRNTLSILPKILRFKPDVIISDFESASHYFSRILNIPCISIDNIHSQTETLFRCDKEEPWYLAGSIKFLHPTSAYYIIPTITNLKPKHSNVFLVSPIIRKEIKRLKPAVKDFILVYQTSPTNKSMLKTLKNSESRFKIYGMVGII
jgi:uncharacterized protein (TIGR00661 family)